MPPSEILTRGTIWCALAGYLLGEALRLGKSPKTAKLARTVWSLGAIAYLAHVIAAFHYFYGWSHTVAWNETARQTEQLFKLNWGGGIYVNYFFTALWLFETSWWWSSPQTYCRRSSTIGWAVRGFFLFIIFNAAVVFPQGAARWVGLVICLALIEIWRRDRKNTRLRF